jgi:hypothetical protein
MQMLMSTIKQVFPKWMGNMHTLLLNMNSPVLWLGLGYISLSIDIYHLFK